MTPNGRGLGAKRDTPDARDHRYGVIVRQGAQHINSISDLRSVLPPAYDQGAMSSCGPNAMSGLLCHQFPEHQKTGFSRLQIYADVRNLEGDFAQDDGVETRDLFKVVSDTGAVVEPQWPYDPNKLFVQPGELPGDQRHKLASYQRLVADNDMLACLSEGFPFILGFSIFESFDGHEVARTGVFPMPNSSERNLGGHDVLVVGHDINFKTNPVFVKSGVDPARMTDEALLIRNSWGTSWGDAGYCWLPLLFCSNTSTGGDAWTGRRFGN